MKSTTETITTITMNLRLILFTALLLAPLAVLHAADAPKPASRPNIIYILADDFGLPDIGCYGGAYKTPNLDALAARGTRFEYCFAAPLCAPTRAMGMFGRYGFRTGVTDLAVESPCSTTFLTAASLNSRLKTRRFDIISSSVCNLS